MLSRTEIVERELEVEVPAQYAAFLEKYGIYDPPGIEVYGINEKLFHYNGIPCVIGATESYRRDGLPHRFLVIFHTGYEDEVACLDTENGKVYAIELARGRNVKIADSFDEWFDREILHPSKETQEHRDWIAAYWLQRAKDIKK
jgi:hypothetical protein